MAEQLESTEEQDEEERLKRVLDPEIAARRRAALERITQFGDPVLKAEALPITRFDDALREEVAAMGSLMDAALGVGLAAPQVGKLKRLLVYRTAEDGPLAAVINPVITWASKEKESYEEGCLSLQNVLVDVDRPIHIEVAAQDAYGDPFTIEASGFEARVLQHEMDHLDGVLILERASRDQRKQAMRILREAADRT